MKIGSFIGLATLITGFSLVSVVKGPSPMDQPTGTSQVHVITASAATNNTESDDQTAVTDQPQEAAPQKAESPSYVLSIGSPAEAQTTSARVRNPLDGRYYQVVNLAGCTYAVAANDAQRRGGYLMPLYSLTQHQWLVNTFGTGMLNNKWAGPYRARSCYIMPWYNPDTSPTQYINSAVAWNNRNNSGCSEDRAMFYPDGKLNDISANAKLSGYVMIYPR